MLAEGILEKGALFVMLKLGDCHADPKTSTGCIDGECTRHFEIVAVEFLLIRERLFRHHSVLCTSPIFVGHLNSHLFSFDDFS